MSEATENAAPTTTENTAPAHEAGETIESRASRLFGSSEPAGDAAPHATETPSSDTTSSAASVDLDKAAQERAARRAQLAQMQERERSKVDAMAAIRERDELRRQLEEERSKTKAYEAYIDPRKLSKEQFFALAEQNPDLTPSDLGEWLREQMANPDRAAAQAAKKAVDPEIAALKQELSEAKALIQDWQAKQSAAAEEAEERAAAEQFFSFTTENADAAPLAANFLREFGTGEFYKLAKKAAELVPPHAGPQAILDEIEENLAQIRRVYAPATTPQRTPAMTPQAPAAAKAPTTVTNTLAQQRSSLVDEAADFASLSVEERAARIFGL